MTHCSLTCASLLIALAAPVLVAQTITGSITGTVTDASGGVVANVKVSADHIATGVSVPTRSNAAGIYNILFLAPGDYNVSAEGAGFRKSVLGPFVLEVNQIARVDVSLEIGDLTQSVQVTAVAPILQSESASTGDTITSTKLTSLPLNGRNFAGLLTLLPGAVITNPATVQSGIRYTLASSRPQVNGNREGANNFVLDGADITESRVNRIGYQPNVDALEEVKVVTGNGGAEFGNVGGASVVMSLKSGTNAIHGNVFEFLRNDKLDANGFFGNRNSADRIPLRRNTFGGTLGGPLRRNRAFFFVDYEGTVQRYFGSSLAAVAPIAWRGGDLSQLLKVNEIVRDPQTGSSLPQRHAFPGNVIPPARIVNPVAVKLFSDTSIYPLSNNAGTGALGVVSNYLGTAGSGVGNHQGDVKLDWRPSDRDTFSGHWSISRYNQRGSKAALPVSMTSGSEVPTTHAVVTWTRTFSTRWVNETRVAYTRIRMSEGQVVDWSGKLGPDGNARFGIAGGQPMAGLSAITLGDGLGTIGHVGDNIRSAENKYQAQASFLLQSGPHLLKFGGQLARLHQNASYPGQNGYLGSFTFNGGYSGSAFADFLLNALSTKGRGDVSGSWGQRTWRHAVFLQDDWKVWRNLTVNLGLRWEYLSPFYEVADRQLNIDIFTGKLLYPGKTEYGRALYEPYYKEFMPVVGVAWKPDALGGNLVIRAGYRFSTFLEGVPVALRLTQNPPYLAASAITYDASSPGDIRIGFADTIRRGDLSGPRTGPSPMYTATAWELNLRPQFNNQWNLTVEGRISTTTSASLAYVGQRGTHLINSRNANQPLPGTGSWPWAVSFDNRRPLAGVLPNVSTISYVESASITSYHALQAGLRQRFSHGMELLASYTLSKNLTDYIGLGGCGSVNSQGAQIQNSYNRRGDFGPACSDALHILATGGLYEIPVGKGKRFGGSWPHTLDLVFGGWVVTQILTAHSGFPVTITAAGFQSLTGQSSGSVRPNRYRPLPEGEQSVDHWFGTRYTFCTSYCVNDGVCSYGLPELGTFGNAGVGTERMAAYFNLDSSVGKKFAITEKKYVEFRAEFFNLPNHTSFGPPARDITTPATFGLITYQVGTPRNIQLGLKYRF